MQPQSAQQRISWCRSHAPVVLPLRILTNLMKKWSGAHQMSQETLFFSCCKKARAVAHICTGHGVWVQFEVPRHDIYWGWDKVREFIKVFDLQLADFDGCSFGVSDAQG